MRKVFIDRLVSLANTNGMDAVLVCPSEELNFLTGFSPSPCQRFQGLFIKSDGSMFYVCNMIYVGEMEKAYAKDGVKVYRWFDGEVMADIVDNVLAQEGLKNKVIGVNSSALTFWTLQIAEKSGVKFVNAKPLLEEIRIIKTPEELENLRKASSITDAVFGEVVKFIKPGMTEEEISNFVAAETEKRGGTSRRGIIAVGANSSYPHYRRGDGIVGSQDVVLLDIGCIYNGMHSDMSRMIFTGGITDEQKKIYQIIREANETAEAAAVEGAFIPDIDKAARDIIEKAGYGECFMNRLGHGIGYMIHEAPDLKQSNPRNLERGMSFTIEPGINLTGRFGMRIEDVVAITENGTEILNKTTHDLIII